MENWANRLNSPIGKNLNWRQSMVESKESRDDMDGAWIHMSGHTRRTPPP